MRSLDSTRSSSERACERSRSDDMATPSAALTVLEQARHNANPSKHDSVKPESEAGSARYSGARSAVVLASLLGVLFLAVAPSSAFAQNCRKGKPCGDTCIPHNRTCHVGQGSAVWAPSTDTTMTAAPMLAATPQASGAAAAIQGRVSCRVQRVVDGDTIWCAGGRKVRLLLIDAPERNQPPFGRQATNALKQLLPIGTTTQLEYDVERRDRYGRDLAYVHLSDGRIANEELLRAGFAVVSVHQPNIRHVDRFRAAATEAREGRRGLWERSGFDCLPSDHRRRRC
jgi:endonuclease YncB( thermonuclease family)